MAEVLYHETFDTGYTAGNANGQNGWSMTALTGAQVSLLVGSGVMYSVAGIDSGVDRAVPAGFDLEGDWVQQFRLKNVTPGAGPAGIQFGFSHNGQSDAHIEMRKNAPEVGTFNVHVFNYFGDFGGEGISILDPIDDEFFTFAIRKQGDRLTITRNGALVTTGEMDVDWGAITPRMWIVTEPGTGVWQIDSMTLSQGLLSSLTIGRATVRPVLTPGRITVCPVLTTGRVTVEA